MLGTVAAVVDGLGGEGGLLFEWEQGDRGAASRRAAITTVEVQERSPRVFRSYFLNRLVGVGLGIFSYVLSVGVPVSWVLLVGFRVAAAIRDAWWRQDVS